MSKIKKLLLIENSFKELFSLRKIKELCIHYKEILLYIVFGVVTTVVNWLVYALMVKLLHVNVSMFAGQSLAALLVSGGGHGDEYARQLVLLFVSNIVAWIAGVAVAFVTNKIWVFESRVKTVGGVAKELGKFTASRILTGLLEWFGLPLLIMVGLNQTLFGVEGFFAKVIISVAVVILNYVFSKLFVFRKKKGKAAAAPNNNHETGENYEV